MAEVYLSCTGTYTDGSTNHASESNVKWGGYSTFLPAFGIFFFGLTDYYRQKKHINYVSIYNNATYNLWLRGSVGENDGLGSGYNEMWGSYDNLHYAYQSGFNGLPGYGNTDEDLSTTLIATNIEESLTDIDIQSKDSQYRSHGLIPSSHIWYEPLQKIIDGGYFYIRFMGIYAYETSTIGSVYSDVSKENVKLYVNYSDITPKVTPVYPCNVNVKQTNALTFTWQYSEDLTTPIGSEVGQKSYTLIIKNTDTGTSTTYTETTSNQYKEFAASAFDVGSYTYTIQATSNDNINSAVASGTFYVIGPTAAPTINSVSNNSIPTITWTSSQQDAVEIRISQNGTLLWESGLLAGSSRTSYQLPIMLNNGQYTAELRVLNTFGYYTEYDSYAFTLSPTGPSGATNVRITTTNKYGVNIKATIPSGTTAYVVRRERGGTAEIISKFTGDYTDYYVAGNTAYEYAVRTYATGYTDSDYVSIFLPLDGIVIRDCRDSDNFINICRNSSEFDVNRSDTIASTLVQCLGRPYPIKEMGEWITSIRKVSGHVSEEDFMKLTELALNAEKVYFQSNGEFIVCSMELSYEGKYFAGSGMFVSLSLTRIEDELEVEL